MQIKKAAKVGEALSGHAQRYGKPEKELAEEMNVSRQMAGHMKRGSRLMQSDIAEQTLRQYDDPEYQLDVLHEFSDGLTSPVLRGRSIEHHRLSLAHYTKTEFKEVLILIESISLHKPPEAIGPQEREEVQQLVNDLLEARILSDNFLSKLQTDYGISLKDSIKRLTPRWKAKGWLQ